jgi:AraC-like DNA-binding protein
MNIRARLHTMIDDILGQDPRDALIALRELNTHQMPWLEERVVALARRDEWSWARIARLLGQSRQQVHRRFRLLAPSLPHDPMAEHRRWELETARLIAEVRRGRSSSAIVGDNHNDDEAVPW